MRRMAPPPGVAASALFGLLVLAAVLVSPSRARPDGRSLRLRLA